MRPTQNFVRQVRSILKRFARAESLRGDESEREFDAAASEVAVLPREGIMEALDQAVGRSRSRQRAAVYFLCELSDRPEALERLGCALNDPDRRIRDCVLQTIGLRRLTSMAPLLNAVILGEEDEDCRREAIRVAGVLGQAVNFPVILNLANKDYPDLAWTLKDYAREEGRAYLRKAFEQALGPAPTLQELADVSNPFAVRRRSAYRSRKDEKVIAAWGLAKLGDKEALAYLGEMLYDPVVELRNVVELGSSLRAAQAICEIFNLPFESIADHLPLVRKWWEENKDRYL